MFSRKRTAVVGGCTCDTAVALLFFSFFSLDIGGPFCYPNFLNPFRRPPHCSTERTGGRCRIRDRVEKAFTETKRALPLTVKGPTPLPYVQAAFSSCIMRCGQQRRGVDTLLSARRGGITMKGIARLQHHLIYRSEEELPISFPCALLRGCM